MIGWLAGYVGIGLSAYVIGELRHAKAKRDGLLSQQVIARHSADRGTDFIFTVVAWPIIPIAGVAYLGSVAMTGKT